MGRMNEDDVQKKMNEYSGKSEQELMGELLGANIKEADFDNFKDMLMPMLTPEQARKLAAIRREIMGRNEDVQKE